MANETCGVFIAENGIVCGDPAPFFYYVHPEKREWRCAVHQEFRPGDPIPGMQEPRDPAPYNPRRNKITPGAIPGMQEPDAAGVGLRPEEWGPSAFRKALDARPIGVTLTESPGGVKFDSEKVRFDLMSPQALEGLARVLTYGAAKYQAHNWRKGIEWHRVQRALIAHFLAYLRGEDLDPESGLPHIDHVMCNAMFLSEYQKTGVGTDDRWKGL